MQEQSTVSLATLSSGSPALTPSWLTGCKGCPVKLSRELRKFRYEIDRDMAHQRIVFIRNRDNNTRSIAQCHAVETTGRMDVGKLVFHRYGNRYFLSEIWESATGSGRQLSPSAAEREMLARAGSYETETVLARK